jgi:hypothetical protein
MNPHVVARRLSACATWFFVIGAAVAAHGHGIRVVATAAPVVVVALVWTRSAERTGSARARAWADGATVAATAIVAVLADDTDVTGFGLLALLAHFGGRAAMRNAGIRTAAARRG